MSATSSSALVIGSTCHRTGTKSATLSQRGGFDRSDQINQNSRGSTALPGVRVKQAEKPSLYDVERSGSAPSENGRAAKLALCVRRILKDWWSRSGSNRRPEACKATALPTELRPLRKLVGPGRLELPTLRLSGVRSNHLSYGPLWITPGCRQARRAERCERNCSRR